MTVALVTGATGAIGRAIARGLAARGFEIVALCRDPEGAKRALARIHRARFEPVDLALRSSILAFAERWRGPLDVIVNNAAEAPRRRELTSEGVEMQLATNVLAYLRVPLALERVLEESAPVRVINVASYWAGGLELDDLEFERRRYDNDAAYRQSKQANRMLTVGLAERWADRGIFVNACHPGDVDSRLSNSLGFGGHESPEEGADTPVWLATEKPGGDRSGRYFEHRRERPCPFGADRAAVHALLERLLEYGVP